MHLPVITGSSRVHTELAGSVFTTARAEIVIDRPATDVWAVLSDESLTVLQSWNPTVVGIELVSGDLGAVNACVLVTKDTGQTPFFMRTVRLVPNQQRVLRIDAVDGKLCGFVDHSLYEYNGTTQIVYSGYFEGRSIGASQREAADPERANEAMMDYLNEDLQLLKQVVENRAAAAA